MPTFQGVEDVTFDLTKWGGPAGTVPEPSSTQIEEFLAVLREVMPTTIDAEGEPVLDIDAVSKFFEGHEDDAEDMVNEAISAVCSHVPTAAEIKALPFRVKQAFYGFVMGAFLSPEA